MTGTPHISDATLAALAARGWKVNGPIAEKLIPDVAPAGEPLKTEAVALLLWDLAAQVTATDHKKQQENMKFQVNTYRRDLPGYQEPRR